MDIRLDEGFLFGMGASGLMTPYKALTERRYSQI